MTTGRRGRPILGHQGHAGDADGCEACWLIAWRRARGWRILGPKRKKGLTLLLTASIFLAEVNVALREVLDRNRLDQVDAAVALGVSRISVGNWCNGRGVPSGTNLVRLLAYLRQYEPTLQAEDLLSSAGAKAGGR